MTLILSLKSIASYLTVSDLPGHTNQDKEWLAHHSLFPLNINYHDVRLLIRRSLWPISPLDLSKRSDSSVLWELQCGWNCIDNHCLTEIIWHAGGAVFSGGHSCLSITCLQYYCFGGYWWEMCRLTTDSDVDQNNNLSARYSQQTVCSHLQWTRPSVPGVHL